MESRKTRWLPGAAFSQVTQTSPPSQKTLEKTEILDLANLQLSDVTRRGDVVKII